MDKIYIDTTDQTITINPPKYGEIVLTIKEGQVVRYETKDTHKIERKTSVNSSKTYQKY
ncbi:hypothetical protein [Enterococcus faecalis]|uniref:hypothetical protein n=1 Tax=Enterococcus faecalis TaxID=1351 RepID=UPI003D0A94C3